MGTGSPAGKYATYLISIMDLVLQHLICMLQHYSDKWCCIGMKTDN